ncbi:MAG: rubrerythrin family protein [Thermoplasmata archaeon]|jgi:rubrerythrin|nr:rubrerythrin family protein [Thermoplasmatales archaeon]PMP75860.1 MAG: rubrerythrin [Aciduliprofundum sp.]HEU13108.1 rubrerythrin family protein [Euryarchaeota archaeon]
MKKMTEKNLGDAFAGESQAHMRYLIFADVAEKAGYKNIARLFRAISYAEQVHATNHYRALGLIKDTENNLQAAIDGETYEVEEMYPVFNEVAKFQGEKTAEQSTHYALEAEKIHADLYKKAKESVKAKKDMDIGDIYICTVCGYTAVGKVPEKCPVCGAPSSAFRKF